MNSNNSDKTNAGHLMREYGTLIVENFPPGSEFGIDLNINYTANNFLGIKMIPVGLHFIHFGLVNQNTQTVAPRIGFFHCFKAGEIYCTRWNKQEEDIDLDVQSVEQKQRFAHNLATGHLDKLLGAYQFDKYQTWVTLTDFITEDLLNKMNPECGKIYSASNLVYRNNSNGQRDSQGLPDMVVSPESEVKFVSKPLSKHFLYPKGATPSQITEHSIDSSYTLQHLINDKHDKSQFGLLGELQFAFVIFLLGHQFEAFEHWQQLIHAICSCRNELADRADLFMSFIRVLHFQLKQTDQTIFADIVDNHNYLFHDLRTFFMNIRTENKRIRPDLLERADKFKNFLCKTFGWNFGNGSLSNEDHNEDEDDDDDEKPVIVMI